MIRVFISQPMNGKTNDEIKEERDRIIESLEDQFGKVEVVDSFFENAPHDAAPLWFLGESFKLLSTADVAVFAKGWNLARGCKMEHDVCTAYGIKTIEMTA